MEHKERRPAANDQGHVRNQPLHWQPAAHWRQKV